MLQRILRKLRNRAYRKGKRPEPGTILFSPSLDMEYGFRDYIKENPFVLREQEEE